MNKNAMPGIRQGLVLAFALAGCQPDPCAMVEGTQVWSASDEEYLCVVGDLLIEGRDPNDLLHLDRVREVSGSLIIFNNSKLVELPRFSALARIGGSLSISSNEDLAVIHGFPALESLGGAIYIGENPNLVAADLVPEIATVDTIFVALNPRLSTLQGLKSINSVTGDLIIRNNASLTTLELPALEEIGRDFLLSDLLQFRTARFPALQHVGRNWSIAATDNLISLTGFSAIENVGESISLISNKALIDVTLAAPFNKVQEIVIHDNPALKVILGDGSVRLAPSSSVKITANPVLHTLNGFERVTALESLTLTENDSLEQIEAWPGLVRVTGRLLISRNSALTGFPPFLPALESAEDVWIFGNMVLEAATVDALLTRIDVATIPRIGDNKGEATTFDPCPWVGDFICDGLLDVFGQRGTELCLTDPEDCGV